MGEREDEIIDEVERQSQAATQLVRDMCHERGQDDLVAELDADLREAQMSARKPGQVARRFGER